MAEADDLPVPVRQPGDGFHELPKEHPLLGQDAWVDRSGWLPGQRALCLLPAASTTVMVEGGIARDLEQPRGRARVSRLEARVGLERLHEDLRRHVLRIRGAPQLRAEEAVDPIDVLPVEVLKGWLRGRHRPVS